jgi:hypothetical protein
MKKLTLVSVLCRGKIVSGFLMLPIINGSPIVSMATIDDMFFSRHGFVPQRGETISFL